MKVSGWDRARDKKHIFFVYNLSNGEFGWPNVSCLPMKPVPHGTPKIHWRAANVGPAKSKQIKYLKIRNIKSRF